MGYFTSNPGMLEREKRFEDKGKEKETLYGQ